MIVEKKCWNNVLLFKVIRTLKKSRVIPFICEGTNKTLISQSPLRLMKTLHSNSSYYLIQDDLVWFLEDEKYDENLWPVSLESIFPKIKSNIDAIIYDDINNEYLIFKVDFLFNSILF